jgi:hypothetical protein
VVFGRSGGRIIWQPRIDCWYKDKLFAGEPLPEPYRGMTLHGIYRALGCSARLYEFNECFRRIEHPSVRITRRELNERDVETVIHTPAGKQVEVIRKSGNSWYHSKLKWEASSEAELEVAAWREENTAWEWDQEKYEILLEELGDLGAPCMYMPRMNVQSLYLEKMGTEGGIYAIYDWPDTVEAYFRALDACHERLIDVINDCPIEIVNFGENIHARTLSPDLFLKYHLPACRRRTDRLHEAGKFVYSHWDGDAGPLLPYARDTGMDGIEALTPKPQGDVTLEEIKEGLGDDLFLLDGIPAVYFDRTFPVEVLEDCAHRVIELFAPKLVLGISDEISSTGDIERIRAVGRIVEAYNAGQRE